jgi:hypothetical protein
MLWVEPLDSVLISVRGRIGMQVCVLTVLHTASMQRPMRIEFTLKWSSLVDLLLPPPPLAPKMRHSLTNSHITHHTGPWGDAVCTP